VSFFHCCELSKCEQGCFKNSIIFLFEFILFLNFWAETIYSQKFPTILFLFYLNSAEIPIVISMHSVSSKADNNFR